MDYSYIFEFGPKMDLHFPHFPTSLQVKRLAPKGKQMRMDHPFILVVCQNVTFDMVFTIMFSICWGRKTTFLYYCHVLIILCISDSNMGTPILLFQNRILISKLEPYFILSLFQN